jgi:tetratricopeptide (TPR) repeat protein
VEAADHYGRALKSAKRLSSVQPQDVAQVHRAIADANWRLGKFEDAVSSYRQVRKLLRDDPVQVSEMLLKEAAVNERLGRYPQALRTTTRARSSLRNLDRPEAARMLARVSVEYATTLETQGRNREAIRWCERAIAEAEASGDRESLPQAYLVMGYARQNLGYADVEDHYRRALTGFEELRDLSGQGLMLNNLGVTAYYAGRWTEAVELWRRGAEMREQLGDVVNAAYGIVNVGEVDADQGRLDQAEHQFRKALRIWRAADFGWGIAYATLNIGRTYCRMGEFDEGLRLLTEARDRMQALGATEAIEAESRMAEGLMLAGRSQDALEIVHAMCQPEILPEEAVQMPLLERVRGYAWLQLGRIDDARRAFDKSLQLARDRDQPLDVALTAQAIAELERQTGERVNLVLEEESATILRSLGVDSVPEVPTHVGTSGP